MNFLPSPSCIQNSLKCGTFRQTRHIQLLGLIGVNTAAYLYYKQASGPTKNNLRKAFTKEEGSSILGLATGHLFETNFTSLAINSALLFTLGHAHVAAYGITSFWTVFGASAIGGSAFSLTGDNKVSGATAGTAGVVAYNAFRKPLYFKRYAPFALLIAAILYGTQTGDRNLVGGVVGGYTAFLLAL